LRVLGVDLVKVNLRQIAVEVGSNNFSTIMGHKTIGIKPGRSWHRTVIDRLYPIGLQIDHNGCKPLTVRVASTVGQGRR
jgi:hypothetical protein